MNDVVQILLQWWTEILKLRLEDWSRLATTTGIIFVAWQAFTWKRLKVRELRASVARGLAARLNAATDATRSALIDPKDHLSGQAATVWLALAEIREGHARESLQAGEPLRALRQELGVARLHFSDRELAACRGVLQFCGTVPKKIADGFDLALQQAPEKDAQVEYSRAFASLLEESDVLRERAMDSLRDVASFSRQAWLVRAWRWLRS